MSEFKVGDVVEAFGVKGTVTSTKAKYGLDTDEVLPVVVTFDNGNENARLTYNGRLPNKKPSITIRK